MRKPNINFNKGGIFNRKTQLRGFSIAHEKVSAVRVGQYEVLLKKCFPIGSLACQSSDSIHNKFLFKYLLMGSAKYRISNLSASLSLTLSPKLMISII